MTKYQPHRAPLPPRSKEPHPIWRGIGCLIGLIVPALSWVISVLLIEMAPSLGVQIPYQLLGYPVMPGILFRIPGLVGILSWIQGFNNLYALLLFTFVVTLFLMGVIAFFYALLYRIVGPPRYSGVDVPPPNIKVRRYKR